MQWWNTHKLANVIMRWTELTQTIIMFAPLPPLTLSKPHFCIENGFICVATINFQASMHSRFNYSVQWVNVSRPLNGEDTRSIWWKFKTRNTIQSNIIKLRKNLAIESMNYKSWNKENLGQKGTRITMHIAHTWKYIFNWF